ncbi:MAG: hypothetical protein KAR79_00720 [Simkaniaceae bacterium]|nr:hypothetical protein [Simkaniaceae bacterium]
MVSFREYESAKLLLKLSETPVDLSKEGVLTPKRIKEFSAKSGNLSLFFAAERVDQTVIDALFSLAEEAKVIDKMQSMQNGEVINQIEGLKLKVN